MARLDSTFDSSYAVEFLDGFSPGREVRRFYFPGASTVGGGDGLLVRVIPGQCEVDPWVGVFAWGGLSPKGATGVFTCPDPDHLCVVARGAGYVVSAVDPSHHELLGVTPVMGVFPVAAAELIIFADYLGLTAYGRDGRAWRTARLSWDGLQVVEISGEWILGKGWSAPENRHVDFAVDLRTGAHRGGASPPAGT